MPNDAQQWPVNQERCQLHYRESDGLIQCSKKYCRILKATYETGFCSESACHNYRCRMLIIFPSGSEGSEQQPDNR